MQPKHSSSVQNQNLALVSRRYVSIPKYKATRLDIVGNVETSTEHSDDAICKSNLSMRINLPHLKWKILESRIIPERLLKRSLDEHKNTEEFFNFHI